MPLVNIRVPEGSLSEEKKNRMIELVTDAVVEAAGPHLDFEPIGEVKLKGFPKATDLFLARTP